MAHFLPPELVRQVNKLEWPKWKKHLVQSHLKQRSTTMVCYYYHYSICGPHYYPPPISLLFLRARMVAYSAWAAACYRYVTLIRALTVGYVGSYNTE